ncbi:sulfotransferase family protein [Pikeienuella piscinae]|uniref:Sulfotransferase family protein n=1 Tax=Pikeienuella piscinae TaxID=2748098 RepID=A0A7L5BYE8_9RHOB|nr:sulfotransferase family protein [Pikeienuella piscinae]QIE55868.1 sulfotransferase family protein [Pikeienuella piscinae]
MASNSRAKVFCVGFQKTGTTSINAALTRLGYNVASVWGYYRGYDRLKATYVEECLKLAKKRDAVEDMPWPLLFRELDQAFPGAKFILTWRESERWLKSICTHFGANPHPMQELTYGREHPAPVGHEARYVEVYEAHNAAVRAHFQDRPDDLLEMNLENGDGWAALCPFIGAPIPDEPFPRANTVSSRDALSYKLMKRVQHVRGRLFG